MNFTLKEMEKLEEAAFILDGVIKSKTENSQILKILHKKQ